jgi:uncharacterized protein (TIRG00374 family)
VLAWGAEGMALYWMLGWLGIPLDLVAALFVYAISMIAGALSFLPGGLGGAEGTMIGLLLASGAPQGQAVAATVLIRLTTLWFAVGLGLVALLHLLRGGHDAPLASAATGAPSASSDGAGQR